MTPDVFVAKWSAASINERAAAQSHFNDLCQLLEVPNPVDADPTGAAYAFEKAVQKAARGRGFADVWKKDAFAWEYKGRGKDLGDAYRQLLLYRDDLGNPPLLVVSDLDRIQVHTNFTGTTKAVHEYALDDLLDPKKRASLKLVWSNPLSFDPKQRKARAAVAASRASRVGLLATNSIRSGANRVALERIQSSGALFLAWSDEPWILDGASVRVSILGFDDGTDIDRRLDGLPVAAINADLAPGVDASQARRLAENSGKCFMGIKLVGDFTVSDDVARSWRQLPNPSERSNAEVLKPYVNARDIAQHPRDVWLIDFFSMTEHEARDFQAPFAYVDQFVKPVRVNNRLKLARDIWWVPLWPRPDLRRAIRGLARYIATPAVSKHRLFVWLPTTVMIDGALFGIAADDDYTFGVLHSRVHEVWALRLGSRLEDRPRYTNTTSFDTFPFAEPGETRREAVAASARHLDAMRLHLKSHDPALTLTSLYNELDVQRIERDPTARAFPLLLAHEALDAAVAHAYGWEWPMTDDKILEQLLTLNLARSARE